MSVVGGGSLGRLIGQVTGPGGIDIDAPGRMLLLSNVNTYAGQTVITNGTAVITNASALGAGTGTDSDGTVVHSGGTLSLGANVKLGNEKLILDGGTLSAAGTAPITFNGPIFSNGGRIRANSWFINGNVSLPGDFTIDGGAGSTISGPISGLGAVIFDGGISEIKGNNTYTGQTLIGPGAQVLTSNANALGAGSGTDADATIVQAGGSLQIGGGSSGSLQTEKIILDGGRLISGRTSGPVELRSTSILRDTDILGIVSGPGDMIVEGVYEFDDVRLYGENTYTGHTLLKSGDLDVNHAQALGSPLSGTTVTGGNLILSVSTDEPILLDGGYVGVYAANYAGPLSVGTGIINGRNPADDGTPVTINRTLELIGGTAQLEHDGAMTLAGGTTGLGTLRIGGDVTNVDAPLAHHGDVSIRRGKVNINTAFALDGVWVLDRSRASNNFTPGTLNATVDTTGRLMMIGGQLETFGGATFTNLDPVLRMRGGIIDGNLAGVTRIVKSSFRKGWLDNIGAGNDAEIELQRGQLTVADPLGFGSTTGITTVAPRDAELTLRSAQAFHEPIYLDNATGISFNGGLIATQATLAAPLHVGDIGSIINVEGQLTLAGPVIGGGFELRGNGNKFDDGLFLTSPDSVLSGVVRIGVNGTSRLTLQDNGRLGSADHIEIGRGGILTLNERGTANLADRLGDQIPVWLWGGDLEILPSLDAFTSERIGAIDAQFGASAIRAYQGPTVTNRFELSIGEFNRRAGATVDFQDAFAAPDASQPGRSVIRFDNPPALTNGLIGGWATVNQTDFATYGTQGVAAINAYEADINAADAQSNVSLAADATLAADQKINSLKLNFNGTLDLGGKRLNIVTGGLIQMPFNTIISKGTLTAGGDSPGELIIHNKNGFTDIRADITDNDAGPIGLTFNGNVYLSGVNTYSGDTQVIYGTTRLFADKALPAGGDITVSGASLTSEYTSDKIIEIGHVLVRDSGGLSVVNLDALSYTLESGSLYRIIGDGPVHKTTIGNARLGFDDRFTGTVTIDTGRVQIGSIGSSGPTVRNAPFIVNPDGELNIQESGTDIASSLTLQGGILSFIGGATARPTTVSAPVAVTMDSQVRVSDAALISSEINGSHDLAFWNTNPDTDYSRMQLSGDNSGFNGDFLVHGGSLVPTTADALGAGITHVYEFGAVEISAPIIHGRVVLDGGEIVNNHQYYGFGSRLYEFDGPAELTGRVDVVSDSRLGGENTLTLSGQVFLSDQTTLTKTGTGALVLLGQLNVDGHTTLFVNEGMVRLEGLLSAGAADSVLDIVRPDRVEFAAGISMDDNRSFTVTGNGTPIVLDIAGSDNNIRGNGTLGNSLILGPGAVIAPGASAGVLTVDGDYTQLLGAVMRMELGGAGPGYYDRLVITGLFDAGGVFELLLLDGFVPDIGDVFDVLDFNALVPGSAFDQLSLPVLGHGRSWDTSALLTSGEVRVVPEPGSLVSLVLAGLVLGWNPRRG
jgi:hypothetical protein